MIMDHIAHFRNGTKRHLVKNQNLAYIKQRESKAFMIPVRIFFPQCTFYILHVAPENLQRLRSFIWKNQLYFPAFANKTAFSEVWLQLHGHVAQE